VHLEAAAKNTNNYETHMYLGFAYQLSGEELKTGQAFRDALRLAEDEDIDRPRLRYMALFLKCLLKLVDDPKKALASLFVIDYYGIERRPDRSLWIAAIYATIGGSDKAIDAIAELLKLNYCSPKYIAAEPFFETLKNNPRFIELMNRPWPVSVEE